MSIRIGTRVRRNYAPLSHQEDLNVMSAGSPLMQTVDSSVSPAEYLPDRTLTPLVIFPNVTASAPDKTWDDGPANAKLAQMTWHFLNAEGIESTLSTGSPSADYPNASMLPEGNAQAGLLTFPHNLPAGSVLRVWFTAVLPDTRIGKNIGIKTDELVLTTTNVGVNEISFSFAQDTNQIYDPFLDELYLYEWAVANGHVTATAARRNHALANPNSYLRTLSFSIKDGTSLASTSVKQDCTVKVMRKVSGVWTEVEQGTELVSINTDSDGAPVSVTFDFRLIDEDAVDIVLYYRNQERDRVQVSFRRLRLPYDCRPTNKSDADDSPIRYDFALVQKDSNPKGKILYDYDGAEVDCAEAVLDMIWYTSTYYQTDLRHNNGQRAELRDIRVAPEAANSYLITEIESDYHGALALATDGGVALTDNGALLLI